MMTRRPIVRTSVGARLLAGPLIRGRHFKLTIFGTGVASRSRCPVRMAAPHTCSEATLVGWRAMDWIALLASPLAIALVTGSVSTLTLFLANSHADRVAELQARESRERLHFEARERRYEDRRDAVIDLDQAAEQDTDRVFDVECDPETSLPEDYRFPALLGAHARVAMLATPEVVRAADELRASVVAAFSGEVDHWDRYSAALAAYRMACRVMLADDAHPGALGVPRAVGPSV